MLKYNTGILAKRGNEGGSLTRTTAQPSPVTVARIKAVRDINDIARSSGKSVNTVLTKLLTNPKSVEELIYYVRSKYETPFRNPVKLAVQAALLRFQDVATIAKAIGISDAEALVEIETAEYEAVKNANPDGGILPIDTQAALTMVVDEMLSKAKAADLAKTSPELYGKMKIATGDSYDASVTALLNMITTRPDNFGLIDLNALTGTDSTQVDTNGILTSGGTIQDSGTDGGGGSTIDDIFGWLNQAINTVKNASGAINTITGNVTTGVNAVDSALNQVGSTAGASAINNSSLPLIIGAGFALVIIVIIIIYATNKRK